MPASLNDQIKEVKRELAMRRRVFPKWVASGRLEQAEADRRIERLDAVLASLYELQQIKSPSLFDAP